MRRVALLLALGLGAAEAQTCADSTTWFYKKQKKDCAWAGQGNKWRCWARSDNQGALAADECPVSCGTCPQDPVCDQVAGGVDGPCCDSQEWQCTDCTWVPDDHTGPIPAKDCSWITERDCPGQEDSEGCRKWRCNREGTINGAIMLASEACPSSCDTCPFAGGVEFFGHEQCKTACAALGYRLPCIGDAGYNAALLAYVSADGLCTAETNDVVWMSAQSPFAASPSTVGASSPDNTDGSQWTWNQATGGAPTCTADMTVYSNWDSDAINYGGNSGPNEQPYNGGCTNEANPSAACLTFESCSVFSELDGKWSSYTCNGVWESVLYGACCVCDRLKL